MQPVPPIEELAPVPSIRTVGRDRSSDQFGVRGDVAAEAPEGSPRTTPPSWRTGIGFNGACQPAYSWPQCPSEILGNDAEKGTGSLVLGGSLPFWIYQPLECDYVIDRASMEQYADQLLEVHSAFRLARALWLGEGLSAELTDGGPQPTLRRSATDITPELGNVAAPLDDAVAILLAHYERVTGGSGGATLHIPSIAMTAALGGIPGGGIVARLEGLVYRGPLGSVISPGPGYPWGASVDGPGGYGPLYDDSPAELYRGTESDEVWVYVTGPVEYALGPIMEHHTPVGAELRMNQSRIISERQAIYRFNPCSTFAVLVELDLPYAGS